MAGRITLKELTDRDVAQRRAFAESPEGKAQAERNHLRYLEEIEQERRWAADNPPDPRDLGRTAARDGEACEPPDDLSPEDEIEWRAGWDEYQPADD